MKSPRPAEDADRGYQKNVNNIAFHIGSARTASVHPSEGDAKVNPLARPCQPHRFETSRLRPPQGHSKSGLEYDGDSFLIAQSAWHLNVAHPVKRRQEGK